MRDSQKLSVLERTERMMANVKEDAYARHKQTQSANFAAYQMEAQKHVGVAGAQGLGKMGAGGGGSIGSGGLNPAAMMAGMAVGGAIGQNIAGTMNSMMGSMNQQTQPTHQTPPPINPTPSVMYNVAVNGQATGPFDMVTLRNMFMAGTFLKESLVWTAGMGNWQKAGDIEELKSMFCEMPPIPKAEEK